MTVTLWHNPRCSKSRQTLALLEQHGITPEVRLYLDDAPSAAEIREVLNKLRFDSARQLMRTGEDAYKEQGLKDVDDEDALIAAMAKTPKLIERPVAIHGERAALGRPPEDVLVIL
ncbi:arsenate reductase (glutaredoxin) [Hyphobacterium marinum]|uniref:Arsenate reductase n=1 Tax=Hyphobacterium marinum TaxID=3116574 RepID=A0ABU7LX52_9PROT|nr:arsenate reductase (glutaredoxin) [Hyphobacterium sp. Y6023]MEE2565575.1 arsenate reductase (glutaredoxin) [Hyphobacterium sp. Y6023]